MQRAILVYLLASTFAVARKGARVHVTIWETEECTGQSRDILIFDKPCETLGKNAPGFSSVSMSEEQCDKMAITYPYLPQLWIQENGHCSGTEDWADIALEDIRNNTCSGRFGFVGNSIGLWRENFRPYPEPDDGPDDE